MWKRKLKEVYTIYEIDEFGDRLTTFVEDGSVMSPEARAEAFALRTEGQVYTQVDSDLSDDCVYLKGWHLVNRTGVYAVITAS